MNCTGHNVKVTEGNAFALILPLKSRHYIAEQPIDTDIDILMLQDVVVKVGGVTWQDVTLTTQGVSIAIPATQARGTYNVELTALYNNIRIRAAYFECFTIVAWSYQSDVQNYIPDSPIVAEAAFIVAGNWTNAELDALTAELRQAISDAQQAQADAEAAKEHYYQLAEQLTGVAQEQTLTQGVEDIREDISHIDIDTTTLAKQGTNPNATLTDTQTAAQNAETAAGQAKQAADDAKSAALALPSAQEIAQAVVSATNIGVSVDGLSLLSGTTIENGLDLLCATNNITEINISKDTELSSIFGAYNNNYLGYSILLYPWSLFQNLKKIIIPVCTFDSGTNNVGFCDSLQNLEYVDIRDAYNFRCNRLFAYCTNLKYLNILNLTRPNNDNYFALSSCPNLIDIVCGAGLTANYNLLAGWYPTNALRNDISTLVDEGETFANNLEKLLYNIREHIAANLPDRTGLSSFTITFSGAVKAAINADAPTAAAFTNKNWTIA